MSHMRLTQLVMLGVALLTIPSSFVAAESTEVAQSERVYNVAICVWEGVELLDFAGPGEVFASAGWIAAGEGKQRTHVYTVGLTGDPIVSQGFVTVDPAYSLASAPKPDIIVLPGGGTHESTESPELREWVKAQSKGAEVVMSVCTGAFILADAGLLDGQEATTWHGAISQLKDRTTSSTIVRNDRRFIDNGKVVTTAGVSAGIDGALHVVTRLFGSDVARETAHYMEYRWTPEEFQ